MRRLVRTSRDDTYASRRDYQELTRVEVAVFQFFGEGPHHLLFEVDGLPKTASCALGCFVYSDRSCMLAATIDDNDATRSFALSVGWNRLGLSWTANTKRVIVRFEFDQVEYISIWGFACAESKTPREMSGLELGDHLVPEIFYLDHSNSHQIEVCCATIVGSDRTVPIVLKKCSYCGRLLPADQNRNLSSFHHHAAKRTGFQNECRACKKWRINDSFNPGRTRDQLHESSVITRERKLLLREPTILQELKNRHNGQGLKSLIWRQFGRACFNCGKEIVLADVCLDHTRPLCYLWPIDQYATCLCEDCNNRKHDMFPIDFYPDRKLRELSTITGLSYEELTIKDVNQLELDRIISHISKFARELDARTFKSIAQKVREVRPSIDIFKLLYLTDTAAYNDLQKRLDSRPPSAPS